jgi:hypothetical protein
MTPHRSATAVVLVGLTIGCISWGPWQPANLPNPPLASPQVGLVLEWRCGDLRFGPAEECDNRWRDAKGRHHPLSRLLEPARRLIAIAPEAEEPHLYFLLSVDPIVLARGPSRSAYSQALSRQFTDDEKFGGFDHPAGFFLLMSARLPLDDSIVWVEESGTWQETPVSGPEVVLPLTSGTLTLVQDGSGWFAARRQGDPS